MRKKALIVAAIDGFFVFLKEDITILQDMGYEVICAGNMREKTKERMRLFEDMGVEFVQIDFSSKTIFSKNNIDAFFQTRRLLKRKFSLIHCHTPIPGLIVRIAAEKYRLQKKCTVLYTTHGFYFHQYSSRKTWIIFYSVEKCLSLFSDAIITINNEDYKNAKTMYCKKVYKINGVGLDVEKFSNVKIDREKYRESLGVDKDELLIVAVGELSERKNHKVIIDAVKKTKLPDVCFAICGKAISGHGTYDELIERAKKNNVKLLLLGHRHDIPEICHCADIGVLPSKREGLGMSGLEFLASGTPLIASDIHGIRDYAVNGVTAYTAAPDDSDKFADKIIALTNTKNRNIIRENGMKMAEKFDIKVSSAQRRKIYQEILG